MLAKILEVQSDTLYDDFNDWKNEIHSYFRNRLFYHLTEIDDNELSEPAYITACEYQEALSYIG